MIKISTKHYLPHQKQFYFSKAKRTALVCGYGAGKTYIALRKAFTHHTTNFVESGSLKGLSNGGVFYPNFRMAKKLFIRPFLIMLRQAGIAYKYNATDMIIETVYGFVSIMTMERPESAVGDEWTWCLIDEFDTARYEKCKQIWTMIIGRMRGNDHTQIFIVTTAEGFKMTYELETNGQIEAIHAKTSDNPFLPQDYLDEMILLYDEQLLKQYFDGMYVNLNGKQAVRKFSRDIVGTGYQSQSNTIYVGIDFNIDHYSITISEMPRPQELYFMKEIRKKNFHTQDAVILLQDMYPDKKIIVTPDMTGSARSTKSHATDIQILKSGRTSRGAFEVMGVTNPSHRDRLNCTNNAFEKGWIKYIDKSMTNFIKDLEQVTTDENGSIDKGQENLGRVHMLDAGTYTIFRLFPIFERRSLFSVG